MIHATAGEDERPRRARAPNHAGRAAAREPAELASRRDEAREHGAADAGSAAGRRRHRRSRAPAGSSRCARGPAAGARAGRSRTAPRGARTAAAASWRPCARRSARSRASPARRRRPRERAQRAEPARQPGRAPAVAVEDLERLDEQVVGVLEAVGVRQDLPVGKLLGRLALARRGRRQAGEDALGVGLGAAGEQPEAVELLREVVEQQAGARPLGPSGSRASARAVRQRARPDAMAPRARPTGTSLDT